MSHEAKVARFISDYDSETSITILRGVDGDVTIKISGDGEFRIAMSGGKLHGKRLVDVVKAFDTIISAINADD